MFNFFNEEMIGQSRLYVSNLIEQEIVLVSFIECFSVGWGSDRMVIGVCEELRWGCWWWIHINEEHIGFVNGRGPGIEGRADVGDKCQLHLITPTLYCSLHFVQPKCLITPIRCHHQAQISCHGMGCTRYTFNWIVRPKLMQMMHQGNNHHQHQPHYEDNAST